MVCILEVAADDVVRTKEIGRTTMPKTFNISSPHGWYTLETKPTPEATQDRVEATTGTMVTKTLSVTSDSKVLHTWYGCIDNTMPSS